MVKITREKTIYDVKHYNINNDGENNFTFEIVNVDLSDDHEFYEQLIDQWLKDSLKPEEDVYKFVYLDQEQTRYLHYFYFKIDNIAKIQNYLDILNKFGYMKNHG
jgi:hypothetical protein